ncbi:MAG TPA: hypothetical protein VHX65_01510 [Pirellulales bacterium]|jgi:hypothetical protein|nr:hypothetical protein [Pirellulales bacterium]
MELNHLASLNESIEDVFSSPLLNRQPQTHFVVPTAHNSRTQLFRTAVSSGISAIGSPVDRNGGDYGAGLIRGIAACTIGEVKGQGLWIDATFLGQAAAAINSAPAGVKSRFTHPTPIGDALGKFLGRAKNASIDGDTVRADEHFAEPAHNTPDGDLAGYVMDLAESDPAAFGASLAFQRDYDAEQAFMAKFGGSYGFRSPDAANVNNFPHVRLQSLAAVDLVDDPASNPNGLFNRDGVAKFAKPKSPDLATQMFKQPASGLKQLTAAMSTAFASKLSTPPSNHVKNDAPRDAGWPIIDAVATFAASIKLPGNAK